MNNNFRPSDFVYFVLVSDLANKSSFGFPIDYNDTETGERIVEYDVKGYPLRIKFDRSHRNYRVPAKNQDLLEKLRNHPLCLNSPNGDYIKDRETGERKQINAAFKEVNEDKDAEVMIDASVKRAEALKSAIELMKDERKAIEVCLLLGIKSNQGKQSFSNLLLYAEKEPDHFMDVISSSDLECRGLAKKAIEIGILQRIGVNFTAGDVAFGTDFEDVVLKLLKDEEKKEYLQKLVYAS